MTDTLKPLFACQANDFCGTECSYPADMLRVFNGQPWCEACYDNLSFSEQQPLPDGEEGETETWSEMPAFVSPDKARIIALEADVARLREFIANPPKHKFWGAGESDCPRELKAGNGELHTLRCKVCGIDSPKDGMCRAQMEVGHAE